jgi:hypothetical protein
LLVDDDGNLHRVAPCPDCVSANNPTAD